LRTIAEACDDLTLVTGAAGLGRSLALRKGSRQQGSAAEDAVDPRVPAAVLSGSCSAATQAQVERLAAVLPSRAIDPMEVASDERTVGTLIDWACETARRGSLLVYSTASYAKVRDVQRRLGSSEAAAIVESHFGRSPAFARS
jgi:uncharacterized protein YgbK (DUF1537 family)